MASWFITLIRMHIHTGSSRAWGAVCTERMANLFTLSFFVLSSQYSKIRVLGVDVETKGNGVMHVLSAQQQPVLWPQLITRNPSYHVLSLLSYNVS